MRIAAYNILKNGYGREHLIAGVLKASTADIVILEEATDPKVVATIAGLAGFEHFGAREGNSVAFLSKIAPKYSLWHKTRASRTPFLELIIANPIPVRIFGVHFYAMLSNWAERRRVKEVEDIIALTPFHSEDMLLVMGDFNTIAPGDRINIATMPRWLRWLIRLNGGDVRRDALTKLMNAGYGDVFRHLHPDDPGYTLPTPAPNSRLDYCFASRMALNYVLECHVILDAEGVNEASDHYPILVELTI